jgi:hypothetical protein
MNLVRRAAFGMLCMLASTAVYAQVQTGSIAGVVTDTSNAVMPGVTVSVSGDKLIGGVQTQTTDTSGAYRFDRLPPGSYNVKFELQGFRSIDRTAIAISAAFVANVNAKLEVGSVTETITVTGESPTVDTRSNLQQTVMNQEVLEGIPSGRDPWSVAKVIPGVQVSTYDVGGTQSFQQSSLSAHGSSTNDVSYNIDGATVNWPGGGGGATMICHDQGMFEEVNYMTSAIRPRSWWRRVDQHGHQDAGNKWKGDVRYNWTTGCPTPQDPKPGASRRQRAARRPRARQPDAVRLRPQRLRRRRACPRPSLGERRGAPLDHQQAGEREERRRHAGGRRQHLEELFGQGRVLRIVEPEDVVLLQLEQQDSRPSPRHTAQPRTRHRVAGPDQPGFVDAGEVHGHP